MDISDLDANISLLFDSLKNINNSIGFYIHDDLVAQTLVPYGTTYSYSDLRKHDFMFMFAGRKTVNLFVSDDNPRRERHFTGLFTGSRLTYVKRVGDLIIVSHKYGSTNGPSCRFVFFLDANRQTTFEVINSSNGRPIIGDYVEDGFEFPKNN